MISEAQKSLTAKRPLSKTCRTVRDHFWARQGMRNILWVLLPLAIIGGWLYPVLGFVVLVCMGASIVVAFSLGRSWCDVCPRGAFLDVALSRWSKHRQVPTILRSTPFRIGMLAVMMTVMIVRLTQAWGQPLAMGMVFVLLLTVTTVVGIILALPYQPRTWCAFCPMGSMASWIGTGKKPLTVDGARCTSCNFCTSVCPMDLHPGTCRDAGQLTHGDCLKCSRCVVSCPKNALSFN